MDEKFSLEEVIDMAYDYANEQFANVLDDYGKSDEFFEKYEYCMKIKEL